ncbi:hypothetical protein DL768_011577 [Monosporascus sp. mg162]|nr:hypothetical protein DL768_011577 [Monosporascus sp. mg162]
MLRAPEEGADLLSIGIGSKKIWESLPVYASVTKQMCSGVAVIVAAGNDGSDGPFALSDPAQPLQAFGLGSVENEIISTMYHAHDHINRIIEYFTVVLLEGNFVVSVLGSGVDGDSPFGNTANGCDERAFGVTASTISKLLMQPS